jgi:pilus assembly protein Flp/PilA
MNQGRKKMNAIVNRAKAFLKSEDGPTATEYAVMLALIIVVCIASIKAIGPKADAAFKSVGDNM